MITTTSVDAPTEVIRGRLIAAVLRLVSSEAFQAVSAPGAHDGDEIDYAIDMIDVAARELTIHLEMNPTDEYTEAIRVRQQELLDNLAKVGAERT